MYVLSKLLLSPDMSRYQLPQGAKILSATALYLDEICVNFLAPVEVGPMMNMTFLFMMEGDTISAVDLATMTVLGTPVVATGIDEELPVVVLYRQEG